MRAMAETASRGAGAHADHRRSVTATARTRRSSSGGSAGSRARCAGIARMIERDEYCVDILQQTAALRAAVDAVSIMILEDHVQGCVRTAAERGEADRYVDEVVDVVRRTLGRPVRGTRTTGLTRLSTALAGTGRRIRGQLALTLGRPRLTSALRTHAARSGHANREGYRGDPGRNRPDGARPTDAGRCARTTPGAAPGRPSARPHGGCPGPPERSAPDARPGPRAASPELRATCSTPGSRALGIRLDAGGARGHRRPRAVPARLDRGDQPDRDPRPGATWPGSTSWTRSPRSRMLAARGASAAAGHRLGRRVSGPAARGRAGRGPGAARGLGGQEGPVPAHGRGGDGPRAPRRGRERARRGWSRATGATARRGRPSRPGRSPRSRSSWSSACRCVAPGGVLVAWKRGAARRRAGRGGRARWRRCGPGRSRSCPAACPASRPIAWSSSRGRGRIDARFPRDPAERRRRPL